MTWIDRNIVEPGKLPLLLMIVAFVGTFLITRVITRLIRAGRGPFRNRVSDSGLHIHHVVPGLVLMVAGVIVAVGGPPGPPWREIAAVLAGIGMSLVLDEFALILHLDDVYWRREGQASVQAVALAGMVMLAWLITSNPLGVKVVSDAEAGGRWVGAITFGLSLVGLVVCAMKGKYRLMLVAAFVPQLALFSGAPCPPRVAVVPAPLLGGEEGAGPAARRPHRRAHRAHLAAHRRRGGRGPGDPSRGASARPVTSRPEGAAGRRPYPARRGRPRGWGEDGSLHPHPTRVSGGPPPSPRGTRWWWRPGRPGRRCSPGTTPPG